MSRLLKLLMADFENSDRVHSGQVQRKLRADPESGGSA
jgi:hypothetical protein